MLDRPLCDAGCWPRPAIPAKADVGFERLAEKCAALADGRSCAESFGRPGARAVLGAVFGGSPFLSEAILRDPRAAADLLSRPAAESRQAILSGVGDRAPGWRRQADLMAGLRRAKRQLALLTALADIGGIWDVEQVTRALSDFADLAVRVTVRHLLADLAGRGWLDLPDPDQPETGSGLIVMAMGKLGAHELNYSSDIDLTVFYDVQAVTTSQPERLATIFIQLTRSLVRIIEERTTEGYVFRVDLRLRPDPAATPPAMAVEAAESYYESMAQTWERAAFIKARPIAGDGDACAAFEAFLRPFIWRRSLDFAALQDIHAMKRRIHAHHDTGRGTRIIDLKLGRGGIREIEFFAQSLQLIHGGRRRRLRSRQTLRTLADLVENDVVPADLADRLAAAYRLLRRTEHLVQMIDDQQTQRLALDGDQPRTVAALGSWDSAEALTGTVTTVMAEVADIYADLVRPPQLEDVEGPGAEGGPAFTGPIFTGLDMDPETVAWIAALGFADPEAVAERLRIWGAGRYPALRSERSRRLLREVLPVLLKSVATTPDPGGALIRFDEFLSRLPAGVQLFALFRAQPWLLSLLCDIMGTSRRIADHLAHSPGLLDVVLTPGFFETLPPRSELASDLEERLADADHQEAVLSAVRRWTGDTRFRAGIHAIRRLTPPDDVARYLSDIADLAIATLLDRTTDYFAADHGDFEGRGLAVIAMGKLGSREMTAQSDLDLIMVFDPPGESIQSDGRRPLAPGPYLARLVQRLISALTVPTNEGPLYSVDMRLRPSGNAGPLAAGFRAFAEYQSRDAWTWEHMALNRARVIAGPADLVRRIEEVVATTLSRRRDAETLLRDVADMRARIEAEHGTSDIWSVKYARGGLVDIEFIAQYLQLRHAAERNDILTPNTAAALDRLEEAGFLDTAAAQALRSALRCCQRIQSFLRLTAPGSFDAASAPKPLATGLVRAAFPDPDGPSSLSGAQHRLRLTLAASFRHFRDIIAQPAARLPPRDGARRASGLTDAAAPPS